MKKIARTGMFEYFSRQASPHFSLTARVKAGRGPGLPRFFHRVLHAVGRAAVAVPSFLGRIGPDGGPVRVDRPLLSFTMPGGDNGFVFCEVPFIDDFALFDKSCDKAKSTAATQETMTDNTGGDLAYLYLTCLPDLEFSSFVHPVSGPCDTIPRVAWGKAVRDGHGWTMPLNVQVHHAMVTGMEVSGFFAEVENRLRDDS